MSACFLFQEREREHEKEVAELQGALVVLAERLEMTHVAMRKLQDKKSKVCVTVRDVRVGVSRCE